MSEDPGLGRAALVGFVPTLDKAAARAFYEDVLGLRLVVDTPFALVFDANGTTVRVTPVPALTPHPFTTLGWEVTDMTSSVRGLASRGVVFERFENMGIEQDADAIWHTPDGATVAWFKDPDGNLLSVSAHPAS